jgi:hypothetical protein
MSSDRGSFSEWAKLLVWLIGFGLVVFLFLGFIKSGDSGQFIDVKCYDFNLLGRFILFCLGDEDFV